MIRSPTAPATRDLVFSPSQGFSDLTLFDAIIIGAGPAGAAAAATLAEHGWQVLLLEKSTWPREKVCGGCVNADAVATLRRLKLDRVLEGATFIHTARLSRGPAILQVPSIGRAMARAELDRRLVDLAIERGVVFMPGHTATVMPSFAQGSPTRSVEIRNAQTTVICHARVILVADGINGTALRHEPSAIWRISRGAWIGVAGPLKADAATVPSNVICMHIAQGGYVGLVRLPDGHVHLGAAVDPQRCRQSGGPSGLVENILRLNGFNPPAIPHLQGTGFLTRYRQSISGHRLLCLGDACGYVEPFTGEGIAWALASAEAAVSILPLNSHLWPQDLPSRWKALHHQTVGRRQRYCSTVRFVVRRKWLWHLAAVAGHRSPRALSWFLPSSPAAAGDINE